MLNQVSNALVILRRKQVQARTGLSRSSIYGLMKAESNPFPQSIRISPRAVGWLESDIDTYIQARVNASRNVSCVGAI